MATVASPSQQFVPVKEVRGGTIILKDGGLRAVLIASSINLALKSADEQRAIIGQFQAFLNSIDFSIQIVVQSRRLDIKPYITLLESRLKEIEEPLMKVQTREYMDFIQKYTELENIMTKTFFVVVPYTPATLTGKKGFLSELFKKPGKEEISGEEFEEERSQLDQRVGVVTQGLSRIGIRTQELGTEEAVELLYKAFNIGDSDTTITGSDARA